METGLVIKPPTSDLAPPHSRPPFAGVLLIISCTTGAVAMVTPYAFYILGPVFGTAILLFVLTLNCFTNRMLAKLLAITQS